MPDELVPHEEPSHELVVQPQPGTLFRTDDPVEIVSRATEISNALADVLRKKGLTKKISNKDYVQVEGWTLCGSMLGVFPVVEWTRQVEGGWEARVEARTLSGAVVGAAEAECLRSESRWKSADDYSIRSMAQTRAISKALRAPLGFIVALAGYETTPEEEMIRKEPQRAFDIEVDLLPGAIPGSKDAPKLIADSLQQIDSGVDWTAVIAEMVKQKYDHESWRGLEGNDYKDFWRRMSNAECKLRETLGGKDFPPPEPEQVAAAFAYAFSGLAPEIVYIPVVVPEGDDDDDIPFGED